MVVVVAGCIFVATVNSDLYGMAVAVEGYRAVVGKDVVVVVEVDVVAVVEVDVVAVVEVDVVAVVEVASKEIAFVSGSGEVVV